MIGLEPGDTSGCGESRLEIARHSATLVTLSGKMNTYRFADTAQARPAVTCAAIIGPPLIG